MSFSRRNLLLGLASLPLTPLASQPGALGSIADLPRQATSMAAPNWVGQYVTFPNRALFLNLDGRMVEWADTGDVTNWLAQPGPVEPGAPGKRPANRRGS